MPKREIRMNQIDQRFQQLSAWVSKVLAAPNAVLVPLLGDASFRRFFRCQHHGQSLIAMDVPPDKERCEEFIQVAELFAKAGLLVPQIKHSDLDHGFMLVDDLGDDLYFRVLNNQNVDELYGVALQDLLTIAQLQPAKELLPTFDRQQYLFELNSFIVWYLEQDRGLRLSAQERQMFADTFDQLIENALCQPQVCAHRDYHSRNLLRMTGHHVGIVDFQDALWAPITYDLVSLLRDCYIDWPLEKVKQWAMNYYQAATRAGLLAEDFPTFWRWFDWMGVQRHLKATFIFARKYHRDQDDNYLQFIPRTLNYVRVVSQQYPELQPLFHYLNQIDSIVTS